MYVEIVQIFPDGKVLVGDPIDTIAIFNGKPMGSLKPQQVTGYIKAITDLNLGLIQLSLHCLEERTVAEFYPELEW
jgi:hypothetical protein